MKDIHTKFAKHIRCCSKLHNSGRYAAQNVIEAINKEGN